MNNARTFDRLIERVCALAAELPDRRTGDNCTYSMADIALAAFSVFFTQCPSFLSYQQAMEQSRGRNNARSLFQIQRVPSDNHIRQSLDPVEPSHLFSLFDDLFDAFDKTGVLEQMRAVGQTRLIAIDATWYFSSKTFIAPTVRAFLLTIIVLADTGHGGRLFALAEIIPAGDKVGHFLLFGALSFPANLVLRSARIRWRRIVLRKASVFILAAITLEECSQVLFPSRTFDLLDLSAGALGVWFFGWLSEQLQRRRATRN
jgi:hypothetical protein